MYWNDNDRSAPKTPWGPAQSQKTLAPGIHFFSTAGHGGIQVEKLGDVPAKVRKVAGIRYQGLKGLWFEEDCAVLPLLHALPHLGGTVTLSNVLDYYPEYKA